MGDEDYITVEELVSEISKDPDVAEAIEEARKLRSAYLTCLGQPQDPYAKPSDYKRSVARGDRADKFNVPFPLFSRGVSSISPSDFISTRKVEQDRKDKAEHNKQVIHDLLKVVSMKQETIEEKEKYIVLLEEAIEQSGVDVSEVLGNN